MERIWTDVFVDSQCKRSINTKIIQGLGKLLSSVTLLCFLNASSKAQDVFIA